MLHEAKPSAIQGWKKTRHIVLNEKLSHLYITYLFIHYAEHINVIVLHYVERKIITFIYFDFSHFN